MRSRDNLRQFKHIPKTGQEKTGYTDAVLGTKKYLDEESTSFDETTRNEKRANNPEPISKKQNHRPYKSLYTRLKQNWKEIFITVIIVPLITWIVSNIIACGKDIAALNANYENLKENVNLMRSKYDDTNTRSIRSDLILDEVQKNLEKLNQKIGAGN